jgi:hypothetical protein
MFPSPISRPGNSVFATTACKTSALVSEPSRREEELPGKIASAGRLKRRSISADGVAIGLIPQI